MGVCVCVCVCLTVCLIFAVPHHMCVCVCVCVTVCFSLSLVIVGQLSHQFRRRVCVCVSVCVCKMVTWYSPFHSVCVRGEKGFFFEDFWIFGFMEGPS